MKTGVIGAGIAGLATAIRLAVKGHKVTVFEKNSQAGGKISELFLNGFCFDTGPSLFTLPELAEELFRLCGEDPKKELPYKQLEVNCKYFYPEGTTFSFYHDKEKLTKEIAEKTTENPDTVFGRLLRAKDAYDIGAPIFMFSNFHKLSNFNTPPYRNVVFKLHKLDFLRTMHKSNAKGFTDKRLVQLFDRYATYNGSNPYKAPATLNMIAHLENNIGAFFPKKGMYAIVDSLYKLAQKQGVTFRFNNEVKEIVLEGKQAKAIRTAEDVEEFDIIISGTDVKQVANKLMKNHPLQKRLNRMEPSSSALIFYWGIDKDFPELDLHNILFSQDYKTEFAKLFKEKTLCDDPTIYVFISSKMVEGDAPAGCENWFVMINAPANTGQDWDTIIKRARKNIVAKINSMLKTDIEKHIMTEEIASPITIENNTGSMQGALYGTSSNSAWSAFMRHPNYLNGIDNLYFAGGSVHPGGGIPLCLASAKIVDGEIAAKYG